MSAFGVVAHDAGTADACPCGTGLGYAECCRPLHEGSAQADSALRLMRSRYSAYVVHDTAYLLRTWHPRTRPSDLDASKGPAWQGLTVLETADGRDSDSVGEVEFEAVHAEGVLHERSRFVKRAGRWVYVDGEVG
ncbi:YchJ family protein [Pedococcus bigeumensis]|uniref:YchJ family protein n=1 Tax=Pedococcus bigeumensis TaxID=433644 RepID=UPI002FEDBF90